MTEIQMTNIYIYIYIYDYNNNNQSVIVTFQVTIMFGLRFVHFLTTILKIVGLLIGISYFWILTYFLV